jgi:glutamate formiminotransferase/glutamate formiminotransferase/formiminotetrahydrofolate cyclodeaminase
VGPLLLSVPNVSLADGEALRTAWAPARVLDVHSDPDHGRSVYTLAARQEDVPDALVAGARAALERVDVRAHRGVHPYVGALDVAPVVFLAPEARGPATAAALTAGALLGEDLRLPVFLYGDLATAPERRERAFFRDGGPARLAERMRGDGLAPDYGPTEPHPTGGAVLVTARPPLIAFNVDLRADDLDLARAIAAELRESGGGLPGVRAIGLRLAHRGRAQVSVNVHDHSRVALRDVVAFVRARAAVAEAELVGLAPAAALEGLPEDVPLRGFDPDRCAIETALGSVAP